MRLFDLFESCTDDTRKQDAVRSTPDFDISIGRFADEQGQLVADFPIGYDDLVSKIRQYTTASSLNSALLSGRKLSTKLQSQYDALMELKDLRDTLSKEHHVYSGIGVFDPKSIMKNDIFQTGSFISASINIAVASKNNNFKRKEDADDHLLHFILPKGYRGCFYIGPYSTSPEELEIVIFPNERFRLISSKTRKLDDAIRHIYTLKPVK